MNQSFVMLPSYHMNQQPVTALVQPDFVLGADKGMELIESLDGIEAIFMKNDGTKLYSSYASSYVQK